LRLIFVKGRMRERKRNTYFRLIERMHLKTNNNHKSNFRSEKKTIYYTKKSKAKIRVMSMIFF
jgi:hypothetical protein